ncbi:hypothetical protein KUCAC02_023172 [Chaenocephalus aceratus]|uniref:Uncharacterized protein n=1 Tax=Chaenocephalus aceratus TaxID=36190 RepID=A0ACB9XPA2_CHAAC|nr:hypothetical protein KUCAC02_023172 [Chaenocephalus aceratus]
MSRSGSSLSVRMSDIAVDDIRPLFVNFCKRMSVEQWDLLDQGLLDAVKMIVAEHGFAVCQFGDGSLASYF